MKLERFHEARDLAPSSVAVKGRTAERDSAQEVVSGLLPDPEV